MIQAGIVAVGCLDFDDNGLIGPYSPNPIETFCAVLSSIAAVFYIKFQTPTDFIYDVLQNKPAVLETILKAFLSISCKLFRSSFAEISAKLT